MYYNISTRGCHMKNSVGKLRVHDLAAGCTYLTTRAHLISEYFYTLYKPVHNEKSPGA